jgi:hypothetical protein
MLGVKSFKMDDRIIEKGKQSLSFIEQLQNQIQVCREALSDTLLPLTPKVEALEILLWAKLKDDNDYINSRQELDKWFKEKTRGLKMDNYLTDDMKKYYSFKRAKAKEKFKAIMIFIDKKGFMPIGEENE